MVVAVYHLDSGVVFSHSELVNVVAGKSFVNDGNGLTDCAGHGTATASVIAGVTLGVARGARVIVLRILDCKNTGSVSATLSALEYAATAAAATPTRRAVVNLSIGTAKSASLNAAAKALTSANVIVVTAAGNSNTNACTLSPASEPSSITVNAADSLDRRSSFSCYGSCTDLYAPGAQVVCAAYNNLPSGTVQMDGTSFAAPHVSGAIARLLQQHPTATVDKVGLVTGMA